MKKVLYLVIFILSGMNITFAQEARDVVSRINVSEIKNSELKEIFISYQKNRFLNLPINFDESFYSYNDSISFTEYGIRRRETQARSYQDSNSPFYANLNRKDKKRHDSESKLALIRESNGDYIMGIAQSISAMHDISKFWLTTFDFAGSIIDYLPIGERPGLQARIIEAQIHKDCTVDVQRLDFPDNDYIIQFDSIKRDFIYVDNLKGQRIDTKYQITPAGKFKKLEEVFYQPQIYTSDMLYDEEIFIRQRKEKRIE